ncbi:heavy metal translocating P-type ATPase [Kaistia dalseonensis]|uniref:P-type Zn(2+) transporter n=1 Tax=Kaistia dalseonensis TaxID=410840 RepID=A0ABU0H6X9_9HYPH|nr:heavy metal translocating P-type ATPase [Kaistia dalseonensis]MCX5494949.1 heavy metal translocating P-type ATPase [Kaistia dalseonensis]MDQ0437530.1 heavy metal translocating P-type ATPase [Kaistia dalseonensis]
MNETLLHRALFILAIAGLAAGLVLFLTGSPVGADRSWFVATAPVIVALLYSMVHDFLVGRVGVDAIAFVAMTAALALGEPLAGVVVAIMYSGGNLLEDYARGRAERDLKALTDRTPRIAHRREDHQVRDIPVADVAIGDHLLVRAGELLPVDGKIIADGALIDESAVTGEPIPVRRSEGELVRSGTVNAGEAFQLRATATADESTYAGIVRMVRAAQTAKAPFIRMADRFALLLLPATLLIAGLAWLVSGDPVRALAVLVVATPCPLILAAPVALIGGVSRAARVGVLMKGGAALEALAQVRTVIFDKTGTLTEGGARLIAIGAAPDVDAQEAFRLVASLEQASHHVLAAALVETAHVKGTPLSHPARVKEYRGSGLEGEVDGRAIRAGSRALIAGSTELPSWAEQFLTPFHDQPILTVFVAIDGVPSAILVMGDAIRPDAPTAIARLRAAGVTRTLMVTGDDDAAAQAIGSGLDIDAIIADCSPAQKVEAIAAEKRLAPTMMVGDGINDAPALAAATVGVAMGARGATASSEAADVVILADRLELAADAVLIARRARSIALQSIVVGLTLSGLAMVAAAFGLIPPVAGALLQEVIDVAVILNALRARSDGWGSTPTAAQASDKRTDLAA